MSGARVIITGGANGIGAFMTRHFASQRLARVAVIDSDVSALKLLEQRLTSKNANPSVPSDRLLFLPCDVGDENAIQRAVRDTVDTFGGIDGLVNNAGLANPYGEGDKKRLEDWSTSEFEKYLKINLTSQFIFARECAKHLEKTKGSIVNISSSRAKMSEPLSEGYAASKGGVCALTHVLSISLGPRGIRVNAVLPGWIDVRDAVQKDIEDFPAPEGSIEPLSEVDHTQHPVGRAGRGDDIAKVVWFLLDGEQSGFITGQEILVDGGIGKKMIYAE